MVGKFFRKIQRYFITLAYYRAIGEFTRIGKDDLVENLKKQMKNELKIFDSK